MADVCETCESGITAMGETMPSFAVVIQRTRGQMSWPRGYTGKASEFLWTLQFPLYPCLCFPRIDMLLYVFVGSIRSLGYHLEADDGRRLLKRIPGALGDISYIYNTGTLYKAKSLP